MSDTNELQEILRPEVLEEQLRYFKQFSNMNLNEEALTGIIIELEEQIDVANKNVSKAENYDFTKAARSDALNDIIISAPTILRLEVSKALKRAKEFDHPIFSDRLYQAIQDPRTIQIEFYATSISVNIDMETVAGNIEDWASAITKARQALNLGQMNVNFENENQYGNRNVADFFYEKYYSTARLGKKIARKKLKSGKTRKVDSEKYAAKYWLTMKTRLDNCSSLAPFWYIINYGNADLEMSSNRGIENADIKPSIKPTDFVGKAESAIKKDYDKSYKEYFKKTYNASVKIVNRVIKVRNELLKIKKALVSIREAIIRTQEQGYYSRKSFIESRRQEAIDDERKRREENTRLARQKLVEAEKLVNQALGEIKREQADQRKVNDLIRMVSLGYDLPQRVRLGKGVRVSTRKITDEFDKKGF